MAKSYPRCCRCGRERPNRHGVKQGWRWCYRHGQLRLPNVEALPFCPQCWDPHQREHEAEEAAHPDPEPVL